MNEPIKLYQRKINEEDVVKEIMARLAYMGIRIFREKERIPAVNVNGKWARAWAGRPSDAGHPDLHGWIPSRLLPHCHTLPIYIEVKRSKDAKRRFMQERFIEDAKLDGVIAFFASSWGECIAEIAKAGVIFKSN